MQRVKILHCADLHLGAPCTLPDRKAEKRKTERLISFEKIVSLAREKSVDLLLIVGDLFDSNDVSDNLCTAVFKAIAEIPEIKVVYNAGNHDPLNATSPLKRFSLPENLTVLPSDDTVVTFDDIGVNVFGRSFSENTLLGQDEYGAAIPQNEYLNIMLNHGTFRGDSGCPHNSISAEFIRNSGMDYMALGHIHKRTLPEKLGKTYFAYCGCHESQGFDELGEKGCYYIELGDTFNYEFLTVCRRICNIIEFDIEGMLDNADIKNKLLQFLKNKYGEEYYENIYRIILKGSIKEDFLLDTADLTTRLSEELFYVEIKDLTELLIDYELLAKENGLKGIFIRKMLEKINTASDLEKPLLESALKIGVTAFSGEVKYNED